MVVISWLQILYFFLITPNKYRVLIVGVLACNLHAFVGL